MGPGPYRKVNSSRSLSSLGQGALEGWPSRFSRESGLQQTKERY
jgi:hypothetical protein